MISNMSLSSSVITVPFWFLYSLFKRLMHSCSIPQVLRASQKELCVMESNAFMKSAKCSNPHFDFHSWHLCRVGSSQLELKNTTSTNWFLVSRAPQLGCQCQLILEQTDGFCSRGTRSKAPPDQEAERHRHAHIPKRLRGPSQPAHPKKATPRRNATEQETDQTEETDEQTLPQANNPRDPSHRSGK